MCKLPSAGLLYGPKFVTFSDRVALNAPNIGRTKNARNMLSFDFLPVGGRQVRTTYRASVELLLWCPGRVLD